MSAQPVGGRLERREHDPHGVGPRQRAPLADQLGDLPRPLPDRSSATPSAETTWAVPPQRAQVREEPACFGQGRHSPVEIAGHERAPAEAEVGEGDRPAVADGPAASDRLLGAGRRTRRSMTASDRPNQTNRRAASSGSSTSSTTASARRPSSSASSRSPRSAATAESCVSANAAPTSSPSDSRIARHSS